MSPRTLWACALGFVLAIAAIGIPGSIWTAWNSPPCYASSRIYSDAVQLNLALQQFALDSSSQRSATRFPNSLQELVSSNYLSQYDLIHLTSKSKVIYTPPKGTFSSTDTVLTLASDHLTIQCCAEGKLVVEQKK